MIVLMPLISALKLQLWVAPVHECVSSWPCFVKDFVTDNFGVKSCTFVIGFTYCGTPSSKFTKLAIGYIHYHYVVLYLLVIIGNKADSW